MAAVSIRLWAREDAPLVTPLDGAARPVEAWGKNAETGKNERTGQQARSNGLPVWEFDAIVYLDAYGDSRAEVVQVRVASADRPEAAAVFGG